MTPLLGLAARSLWSRRITAVLTVFSIGVSVMLLLTVEKVRTEARESFASTISGTDLIVGARGGPVNLLLYSVFRIGEPTTNVSWRSYRMVASHPDVAWTIPISLGDSHRGFRVVGTSADYFEHFRYGRKRLLHFEQGRPFGAPYEAVLGADVARALGYVVGDEITIAHGVGEISFVKHDEHPFRVAGILAPTGTPVDRAVHVSIEAVTAIHAPWQAGGEEQSPTERSAPPPNPATDAHGHATPVAGGGHGQDHGHVEDDAARPAPPRPPGGQADHQAVGGRAPTGITAFLVGMKTPVATLQMQRALNEYRDEPLLAIMPGVTLKQLWQVVGIGDRALLVIAACVVLAGLTGMVTALLTTLNERRREMAVLRSVGARPAHVFALLVLESGLLSSAGAMLGVLLAWTGLYAGEPVLERRFGLFFDLAAPSGYDLVVTGAVIAAGLCAGMLPAWRAYRNSLADGLSMRI